MRIHDERGWRYADLTAEEEASIAVCSELRGHMPRWMWRGFCEWEGLDGGGYRYRIGKVGSHASRERAQWLLLHVGEPGSTWEREDG